MADERNWLIDHTGIGVSDVRRAAGFYTAALGALGIMPVHHINLKFETTVLDDPDLAGVAYGIDYPQFWIDVFHPYGVGQHTAFRAVSRSQVDAFHAAAIRAGGTDNGAPGLRGVGYPPGYYAAFVRDPDGNNIEAVYRER